MTREPAARGQSTFAPLLFTTPSYFASSAFTKAPNCSGVPAIVSAISVARRRLQLARGQRLDEGLVELRHLGRQLRRAEQAEPGVDVEARQRAAALRDGGQLGHRGRTPRVVTASARSLPALTLAEAEARLSKLRSTWPDSSASCAGLPPA